MSGSLTRKFFALGQTISGTSYFFATDHLGLSALTKPVSASTQLRLHNISFNPISHGGSVREMTNTTGSVESQYGYDSYGRVTKLQGSIDSDFQYASYYLHQRSELSLTRTRPYKCQLGRWITRDPLAELAGANLFGYVFNDPIGISDPLGLEGVPLIGPKVPYPPWYKPVCLDDDYSLCVARCVVEGAGDLKWILYCIGICFLQKGPTPSGN